MNRCCLALTLALFALLPLARAQAGEAKSDCYISTGDNHWLGESLPIDSPGLDRGQFRSACAAGRATRVLARLEEATWMDTMQVCEENCRYASAFHWFHAALSRRASRSPGRRGGPSPGHGDLGRGNAGGLGRRGRRSQLRRFPQRFPVALAMEHPEWVPVDRSGLLRQGGPIEFAYPDARKALVDLHMKFVRQDGYDGVLLITYAENYSMRFQDEFGFNEPIVQEFKRRTRGRSAHAALHSPGQPLRLVCPARRIPDAVPSRTQGAVAPRRQKAGHLRQPAAAAFHPALERARVDADRRPHLLRPGDLGSRGNHGSTAGVRLLQSRAARIGRSTICLWMTRSTGCRVGALTSTPVCASVGSPIGKRAWPWP